MRLCVYNFMVTISVERKEFFFGTKLRKCAQIDRLLLIWFSSVHNNVYLENNIDKCGENRSTRRSM
jgi:hypothetical protein